MNKIIKTAAKITGNVCTVLLGVFMLGSTVVESNVSVINGFLSNTDIGRALGTQMQDVITDEDAEAGDTQYFKSNFASVAEVKQNGAEFCEKVVAEGSVLLKNENAALPLAQGSLVNLYSCSSVNLVYSGTGSSGTNTASSANLKQGLERAGLAVNEDLWNWYKTNDSKYGRGSAGGTVGKTFAIKDASWSNINTTAKEAQADAAVFVLSRNGGEGADLTLTGGSTTDMTNGNYLELSPTEKSVLVGLKNLKDTNKVSSIIVVMNSANQVQCDFVDKEEYGIDALLWVGDLGATGAYAVGDLLAGNVNPSGKLSDTFWKKHCYNPAYANFSSYNYTSTLSSHGNSNSYVVYQEGIYVGYRYTETRYEDTVLKTDNVGEFDYNAVVSYPFGYGLSYTQFEYSNFKVTPAGKNYTVSVKVTNTGDVAGKEVVQVYLQKPYTDYDKQNHIEKPAVELVAFDKTNELAMGESQTLTMTVEGKYFASYDAYGAQTYVVDEGEYFITAAKDAHAATNNILAAKGWNGDSDMTAEGDATMVYSKEMAFDAESYKKAATGADITNQFDNADINRYEGAGSNHVNYISRNDWAGTVVFGVSETHAKLNNQVKLAPTEQMKADVAKPTVEPDEVEYPTYGADNGYSLIMLRAYDDGDGDPTNDVPIPYDDPLWDALLDQMTWDETVMLLSNGLRKTYAVSSVGKPQSIDHNGATGPVQPYNDNASVNKGLAIQNNDPDKSQSPTLYPSNGLVASTYNVVLIEEFGEAMGEDCLWAGYSGLYGTGVNIHRTAYGGRVFEYYSEDAFLTGKIAAAETLGIQSRGCYVYLKHCVLNDQEKNREGICTWANEQTIRENYLRAFQIAIEEGGAYSVMTAFNRLGVKWSGHQGFCNTVLHGEFGMRGFAVSDWYQDGYMTLAGGILNGNDIPDGDRASAPVNSELNKYKTGYGTLAWAMRESAHRILYATVHSNLMNGLSSNTKVVSLTPGWLTAFRQLAQTLNIVCGVGIALWVVAMAADEVLIIVAKKKNA